jgi:tRNA pseudouridine-54 N-methylase
MDAETDAQGERAKAARALKKKLRHIDELNARAARGDSLDAQQRATVARERALRADLAACERGDAVPPPPAAVPAAAAPYERYERKRERAPPAAEQWTATKRPSRPPPPPPAAAAPVDDDGVERCGFCRAVGHVASHCTFGQQAGERVMACPSRAPTAPCASRLFVLPMRRCAYDFDPTEPRAGRVDVGLRCLSAALFRSQGLRRNTQVALCFEGEPAAPQLDRDGAPIGARTLVVSGALVRDLRPDELSLAARVREALDDSGGGHASAAALDAAGYSASRLRGLEWREGGALPTLLAALRAPAACAAAGPPCLLVLDNEGEPVEAVCARLCGQGGARPAGSVVVVVGDDRGLTADENAAVLAAAREVGARVERVTLGREVLFASHCVVLLNHYLDKLWHGCEWPQGRRYSTSTRTTGAKPARRPSGAR